MVTVEDFSRVVSSIYDSAVQPEQWTATMSEVHTLFGATGAGLVLADSVSRAPQSVTIPTEALNEYRDYYRHVDYILEAVEAGPVGLVRGCQELSALQPKAEFHMDWMCRHHLDDGLFVRLTDGPEPATWVVATEKRSELFDTTERVHLADALVPHFQRALRIQHDLSEATHQIRNISSAMDNVTRIGMAVVDCSLSVRYLNTAAENIVRGHDGLSIRDGTFVFAYPAADAALRSGINAALGQAKSVVRGATSMLCPRPSGLRPYVIHVLPFQHVTAPLAEARALVLILDPDRHPQPDGDLLRQLYGLTTAEAAVAIRLMQGDGIKPIADSMYLSAGTVRTHVQHIFDKTGTHRQAELVRTLLAISL
ncbi:hypothetical protein BOO86_16925 [Mycobacterium sp. CBMA 234]|nr:hypothetical protein [Mycolicibacterium sp. CBMA 234]